MTEFPFVPFAQLPRYMQWQQGEHATLIAPTGQGKTTMVKALLPRSPSVGKFVMVLVTKRKDKVLTQFEGYKRMEYPQMWAEHVLVVPPFPRDPSRMLDVHRDVFRAALNEAYASGGWTVYADEVRYLSRDLGLERDVQRLLLQGRSLGVTFISSTQRPRYIPLEAYDQPTHLFFWRDSDRQNTARIADIGGTVDRAAIQARVAQLPQYRFVYTNTRTGDILESKVDSKYVR